jgi:hypothetical protein
MGPGVRRDDKIASTNFASSDTISCVKPGHDDVYDKTISP